MLKLIDSYKELENEHKDYYGKWTFDKPIFITEKTTVDMKFVQNALNRCIRYFVANIDDYIHIMPISNNVREVLRRTEIKPYETGTYRTDFIITEDNQIKLIEITCRFALNGFIRSGFVDVWGDIYAQNNDISHTNLYYSFFEDLEKYFENYDTIYMLKDDSYNEGRYIKQLFDVAGKNLIVLTLDEIPANAEKIRNSACISQLTHEELLSLPIDVIDALIDSRLLNDLRTVFLAHDKRFFAVMNNDEFRQKALGDVDSERFKSFLTPTYTRLYNPELWNSIRNDKDNWIIKPRSYGRSVGIATGSIISQKEWEVALDALSNEDAVFQPYLKQRLLNGNVGEEVRTNNYVAGTLLFFQDKFFGMGMFRASNHPITNFGDDRKLAPCHLTGNNTLSADIAGEDVWIL